MEELSLWSDRPQSHYPNSRINNARALILFCVTITLLLTANQCNITFVPLRYNLFADGTEFMPFISHYIHNMRWQRLHLPSSNSNGIDTGLMISI